MVNKTFEGKNFKFFRKIGFLMGYIIFTTVWYFILSLSNRLPADWTYFSLLEITFVILLFGYFIKKYFQ